MSMDERLRGFIQSAGEPVEVTEMDWNAFILRAHRDLTRRRGIALAVAAVLVVVGFVGARAVLPELAERRRPAPVEEPRPEPIPENVPRRCVDAPAFAPEGELGAVAYSRGRDIHLVDLTSGEDRVLARASEGTFLSRVRISPNGQWVAFGPGYVVPAAGGPVCAPLGTENIFDPSWTARGDLIAGAEGVLLVGSLDGEAREIQVPDENLGIGSYVLDSTGESVAFDTHDMTGDFEESIWTVGLYTETTPQEVFVLSPNRDESSLQVAAYSPGLQAVLAFKTLGQSASISADQQELLVVRLPGPSEAVKVVDMLGAQDFIADCGGSLVVAAGTDRDVTTGKYLIRIQAPDFQPSPLAKDANRSFFEPVCASDGRVAATVTPDGSGENFDRVETAIFLLSPDGSESELNNPRDGFGYEFPRFARRADAILAVERQLEARGRARLVLIAEGEATRQIADLGKVFSVYGLHTYSTQIDWYQP